jgi:hypothetical protein
MDAADPTPGGAIVHHVNVKACGLAERYRTSDRFWGSAARRFALIAFPVLVAAGLAGCAGPSGTDNRAVIADGSPIESLWASYTCSPVDSTWVQVIVNSSETVHVVGQLWVGGEPSRMSQPFLVDAGKTSSEGLNIIPPNSWGKTAELRIGSLRPIARRTSLPRRRCD